MPRRIKARQQLNNFMEYYGLTPPELACRMSPPIERQTVMRWCDGTRRPSIEYQNQLYEMSGKKIDPSGWLTDKELAKEKIKSAWFKKYPVQQKENDEPVGNVGKNGNGKHSHETNATGKSSNGSRIHGENGVSGNGKAVNYAGIPASNSAIGASGDAPIKRKPGRPKGSTNRPGTDLRAASHVVRGAATEPPSQTRPRGRPRSVRTSSSTNSESGKSGESSESAGSGSAESSVGASSGDQPRVDTGSESRADGSENHGDRKNNEKNTNSNPSSLAGHATHKAREQSHEPDTKPTIISRPTGPVRKNHTECSSDDPMTRMQMMRNGDIQFELVDDSGNVLAYYQDVVAAINVLDNRIHPTSHAVRCKFCWTEVSVYTPPKPEVTERLARAVTEVHSRRDGKMEGRNAAR